LDFFAGPPHRNYSVVDFDRKLNYAQTVIYDLPAGRGHQYFSQGPLLYALGGWRVSGVIQAVSGLPFTITSTSATPGTTQTGDLVAPFQVTHNVNGAGTATWFNPASFAAPATCTAYTAANPVACVLGNTGRGQFRGPAYVSDNVSLSKAFPVYRESNLEARFDAFNMTNTPAFGLPTASIGSNLGKITSTLGSGVGNVNGVGGPRVLQASVKFTF
jgi:hypothetical protein